MSNVKPEAINRFEVYLDGNRQAGVAEVELPSLQAITVEMKGAGIGGQWDEIVKGHFQGMTMKLTFRTATKEARELLKQQYHHIELWGAIQRVNPESGRFETQQDKVIVRACPKNITLGKFAIGEVQGREMEFEVTYIRELVDNEELYEIDKMNDIYTVNGEDLLADIKAAIGL